MSSPTSSSTESGDTAPNAERASGAQPKHGSVLGVALTLGLLALFVWGLTPRRVRFKPAPLDPATTICTASKGEFVPSNLTEIPGVPLATLPEAVKNRILLRLNMEPCSCGCAQSLGSCRASNPQCPISPHATEAVVKQGQESVHAPQAGKPMSPP